VAKMCSNGGLLVAYVDESKRALITRANCDMWACSECSARLRERWIMRAKIGVQIYVNDGLPVDFVTITSHEKLKTFEATEKVWRSAWNRLYKAIKRRAETFEYFCVPEKHKDGRMHVHLLWTAGVSQRWVKDNARERGLGYQALVRKVDHPYRAALYVGKYVGKDLGTDVPRHFRRVRVSRGWVDLPDPVTGESYLRWQYLKTHGGLDALLQHCEYVGYQVIDIKTGELISLPA